MSNVPGAHSREIDRRNFLRLMGAGGAAFAISPAMVLSHQEGAGTRWSDPQSWNGRVPRPTDIVTISRPTILDSSARVAGLMIAPGGALVFDPEKSVTLETTGNIVVEALLSMKPANALISHRIRFLGVTESRFTGGGMRVLPTDVGLWVMGAGALDLSGTQKIAWTRHPESAGWSRHDELLATAVDSGSFSPAPYALGTKVPEAVGHRAEILNLTRNVVIEGTPGGRSHVFIHSSSPQSIRYVELRHMGPPEPTVDEYRPRLGRYPLHFHHCRDGSRGSLVEGVVVRHSGNHAFVPHASNGIRFVGCIAYDIIDDAYWWDPRLGRPNDVIEPEFPSHDTSYEACVAAQVRGYEFDRLKPRRLAGFRLGSGSGNSCVGCVATDVAGYRQAAGFVWPEGPQSVWRFEDCVAHNNRQNGIFTWQNSPNEHVITRFLGYRNRRSGIEHGAYHNRYQYRESALIDNPVGVILHATSSKAEEPIRFQRILIAGAAIGVEVAKPNRPKGPARFEDVAMRSVRNQYAMAYNGNLSDRIVRVSTGAAAPDPSRLGKLEPRPASNIPLIPVPGSVEHGAEHHHHASESSPDIHNAHDGSTGAGATSGQADPTQPPAEHGDPTAKIAPIDCRSQRQQVLLYTNGERHRFDIYLDGEWVQSKSPFKWVQESRVRVPVPQRGEHTLEVKWNGQILASLTFSMDC